MPGSPSPAPLRNRHNGHDWLDRTAVEVDPGFILLDAETGGFDVQQVVGATLADVNQDRWQDLLGFCGEQLHLFLNESRLSFVRDEQSANQFSRLGGTNGQAVDVDNDADLDLLIADAHRGGSRGPVLLLNDRGTGKFHDAVL